MHPSILYALTFAPAVVSVAFFVVLKRRQRPATELPLKPAVRIASLNISDTRERGWWMALLSTLLLPAGAAALLTFSWQVIPERFPVHWGIDGQPNGWANRSFGSVFGMLILDVVLVGMFGLLGGLIARSSPGHEGRATLIKTVRTILIACAWFIALLLCSVSLLPLARNPTSLVPFVLTGAVLFSVGIVGYVFARATQTKDIITASQNTTEIQHWKAGFFYFNPSDSALMVPKREGFGYTLNFGRPVCWLILAAILLVPLVLPLFLHVTSHR